MRKIFLAGSIATLLSFSSQAAYNSSSSSAEVDLHFAAASGHDGVFYSPSYKDIDLFGAKVTGLDSCDGNIGLSISNAFTDGTIKRIYENFSSVLKSFDGSSAAIYLSSLYIQKSNAGLYQLITEGIDIGLDDFLSGMASCEAMAAAAVSMIPDSVMEAHKASELNDVIERNSSKINKDWSKIDITKYIKEEIPKAYDKGINWFGGKRGGENQAAADIVRGSVKYGYCIFRGVSKNQCDKVNNAEDFERLASSDIASAQKQTDLDMEKILLGDGLSSLEEAAVQIIGTEYLTICEGCETISVKAGGIKAYMTETHKEVFDDFVTISAKPINSITELELLSVSGAPPKITLDYFRAFALLENNWELRNKYINGVAYDVAYQRSFAIMDRIESSLVSAQGTSEVKDSGLTQSVDRFIDRLDKERNRLLVEAESKRYVPLQYSKDTLGLLNNKSLIKR